MKMRDLERASGVGRETIRYYIRLGLLPEPTRPKPNVADYSDEHVRRLAVIKRLQAERYLPLSFIKDVLDRPTGGDIAALPGLDSILIDRLGAPDGAPVGLDEAAAAAGLSRAELEVLIRDGVVSASGETLTPLNLAIAKAWGAVRAEGYTEAAGFYAEDAAIYAETLAPLTRREIERFYGRLSGAADLQEMARLGLQGIERINALMGLIRTRMLLELIAEMNARAGGGAGA